MEPKRLFLFAALALILGYALLLFRVVKDDTSWREDFTAFYTGWTIARSPDRGRLYDLNTQREYQSRILASDGHDSSEIQDGLLPYLNPPHITILFSALTLLPRRSAFLTWMIIQICLLLLLWHPIKDLTEPNYRLIALAAIIAFPLTVMVIGIGALSILVAISVIRANFALRRDRVIEAAFWLTLATVKPQMLLFPLFAFLIVHGWRLLASFIGVLSVLTFASFALIGWQPFFDYPRLLSFTQNHPGRLSLLIRTSSTARGALFMALGYERVGLVNKVSLILMILGLATVAFIWWRGVDYDVGLAFTVVLGLSFGLHVNPADDFLLILAALLLYHKTRWQPLGFFLLIVPFAFFIEWRVINLRLFSVTLHLLVVSLLAVSLIAMRNKSHNRLAIGGLLKKGTDQGSSG